MFPEMQANVESKSREREEGQLVGHDEHCPANPQTTGIPHLQNWHMMETSLSSLLHAEAFSYISRTHLLHHQPSTAFHFWAQEWV